MKKFKDLPTVTILMAIYKPRIDWLIKQIVSLNNQTYPQLTLLVWNDCPEDVTDYVSIFNKNITNFSFKILTGTKNLGSNGAFSELTKLVNSDYIAYCDQDDIWLPEKITLLVKIAKKINVDLVCSDMYVIDENDNVIADSITKVKQRQKINIKREQFKYLLSHNFVTGCTVLVKTNLAKKALPFPKEFIHDWWLALYAANIHSLYVLPKPLIKYRIHGNNQTKTLSDVEDKRSYFEKRLLLLKNRINIVKKFFYYNNKYLIDLYNDFINYRIEYQKSFSIKLLFKIYKLRYLDINSTYLELMMPIIPNFVFKFLINNIKKGNI